MFFAYICNICNFRQSMLFYVGLCRLKKQSSPATSHGGTWGERRSSSYSFLTLALDGVSGQRHAMAALCPGERIPGIHCTGGWVGPRAGLDTEARGKILCPCWVSNPDCPVVQFLVRHYTDWATPAPLCRLSSSHSFMFKVKKCFSHIKFYHFAISAILVHFPLSSSH
jgi:hypothetical protein